MPKNIWITKKRRKNRKGKSSDSDDAEIIERSRMADPNEPSISIGMMSDLRLNIPVKIEEEAVYPDTRFQSSTTLFPAIGVEENSLQPETPSQTLKRSAENELISTKSKKGRVIDPPGTIQSTISDDCLIIEKPKTRVKVEVIDLTDDSQPIVPVLCSPVKTSYRENRLPENSSITLPTINDVRVKVESNEKRIEIDANAAFFADVNYCTIQANAEQNNGCEVNVNESFVEFNQSVDRPMGNFYQIQVKTEKSVPTENARYNETSIEHSKGSRIQIKAEKSISSENNTEVNSENFHLDLGNGEDSTTHNIILRSEQDKENEDNTRINVAIKLEHNENCSVSDNSGSLLNISSLRNRTGMYFIDREQNNTNESCEEMDFQNSYSYEKPQNNEDTLQKIVNSYNKTTGVVLSETSIPTEFNHMSISPVTDGAISSDDVQLYEPGTFRTPLLKYLNCNTKVEIREISCALSVLIDLIKNKEIGIAESEVILDSFDSQDKSELRLVERPDLQINEKQPLKVILDEIPLSNLTKLVDLKPNIRSLDLTLASSQLKKSVNDRQVQSSLNSDGLSYEMRQKNSPLYESHSKASESTVKRLSGVAEKVEELPYLQVNEKQSLSVGEILDKISLPHMTELVNLKSNITNLDSNSASSRLIKSVNERQVQILLNNDGVRLDDSPNMILESHPKSASSRGSDTDSRTIYFNSPMDIENPLEDNSPSIICLSTLDNNERSRTSNSVSMKEKNRNESSFSNAALRQILGNVTPIDKSDIISNSPSPKPLVDSIAKSNTIIDESLFHNLRQITLPRKKQVQNMNFATKRSHGVLFNPPITDGNAFETLPKRVKTSEDDLISNSGSVKKLDNKEYKRNTRKMDSQHYPSDHLLGNHLGLDVSANSPNSSSDAPNSEQNIFTSPANQQNSSLSVSSETSLQNSGYCHLVNTSSPHDPRLVPNYSPVQRDVNSQNPLNSFYISQTCPSQSIPEVAKLSVPLVNQITSGSTIPSMPNFSRVISPVELYRPTINAMQIQQVNPMLSQMNNFQPPYLNQQTSASESISFSMTRHNPQQLVQGVRNQQPFHSFMHLPGIGLPFSQYHHLIQQEILPPISMQNTFNHNSFSSESVNFGCGLNPPLPDDNPPPPPPPLPPTPPPIVEQPPSNASNISPRTLLHNNKLAATKNLTMPNQSSSNFFASKPSLLPKNLREDIGKNIIKTNEVYLIIIERNIDWINGIDKEIGIPRMSEIGGEFQQVRNSYRNHLMYYNTYFPLLLLECFNKISTALKATKQKEKKDKNICKVVQCETKQNYVSFTCDSFIRHSEVENIPKDGHIILIKFAAIPEGNVRMLGYVYSSATRAYSHRHDHGNEILKYVNVNKRTDLIKIRINFYIVFEVSDINLDVPIHISKLTSIKKVLVLNDALRELRRSSLCDVILGLRNQNIKSFTLPRRQDANAMTTVVQEIVQSLNPSSSQLTIVKSAPFTDSFLAIVQIVEEIQKSKIPGKILVCVRSEMLCQMGMNLMETSSNVVIINRDRESVHEKLHSRVLDVKISHVSKAENLPDDMAKSKVLQEAEVLLAVTGICFYEDVQSLARDLTYCIIHDAHSFTEPESLLPLLYGIRHLLLFGDPDESCIINSKCGASLGFNKSLFHRAYNLC